MPTQTHDGSAVRRPQASSVGPLPFQHAERVGPYRLCFEIASGGMATVCLSCVDLPAGIQRFVALKRLHPHLMRDPLFVEMFLDEARIASQIQHANVCSVFDFGVADGTYYLAMEYLAGEPLSTVRRAMLRRPRPLDANRFTALACRMIADAAEGIHAAHELCDASGAPLDVVHRDVSPDNVFLTYDGVIKIVDFGVARATRQKHQTRSGVVKGKFSYIAPEVLRGRKADRRADIWGLGVILWELLTLKRLFNRKTDVETLHAVLDATIPAPSKLQPGLPRGLDEIVLRALSRNPAERYQTARELGRDLTRFLAEERTAVGLAELSECMCKLFPGGRTRNQQLLEVAERVEVEPEPESIPIEIEDCLTSIRKPTKSRASAVIGVLRAHPRATAVATLFLTAVVGAAFGRNLIGETKAVAAVSTLPAPPASRENPAPTASPIASATNAKSVPEPVPIALGNGTYVLEIATNPDTRSGVVVRIKNASSKQRVAVNSRAAFVAPRTAKAGPEPLITIPMEE
jgi:serine/threonine protein kinase